MTDITGHEIIELGMLAAVLCLAAILFVRDRRKPADKRSRDDDSSYYAG